MSLVNITLVGNLVRPPETTQFASGSIKTTMIVAANTRIARRNLNATEYYRVETWGKLAELADKYLETGNQIGVCGRLILDRWTDKEGKERVTPIVEVNQLSFPPRLRVVSINDRKNDNPLAGTSRTDTMENSPPNQKGDASTDSVHEADSGTPANFNPKSGTKSQRQTTAL
jgi:single-strand DNA-binding protein